MLVVPGKDTIQAIQEVFFLVKALGLARVDDQLGLNAVVLEATVEFLALARGIGRVGISLENQRRRLSVFQVHDRGTVQKTSHLLRLIRDAVEPLMVGGSPFRAVFGDEL